jgi:hypothetical protein
MPLPEERKTCLKCKKTEESKLIISYMVYTIFSLKKHRQAKSPNHQSNSKEITSLIPKFTPDHSSSSLLERRSINGKDEIDRRSWGWLAQET